MASLFDELNTMLRSPHGIRWGKGATEEPSVGEWLDELFFKGQHCKSASSQKRREGSLKGGIPSSETATVEPGRGHRGLRSDSGGGQERGQNGKVWRVERLTGLMMNRNGSLDERQKSAPGVCAWPPPRGRNSALRHEHRIRIWDGGEIESYIKCIEK